MAKPSRTSLVAAATTWDAALVAADLASAPELVKVCDPRGRTALHRACAVKPGVVPNSPSRTGSGPLQRFWKPVRIARVRRLPKEMIDRLEHLKSGMQARRA